MFLTISGGTLPTQEQFDQAFDQTEMRGGLFHFGNDERVGTDALNATELWKEVQKAHEEDTEESRDWVNCVLSCIGIEVV